MKRKPKKSVFLVCEPGEKLFPSTKWDREIAKPSKVIQRVQSDAINPKGVAGKW